MRVYYCITFLHDFHTSWITGEIISIFRLVCLFPGLLLRVQPVGDAAGPEPGAETALQSRRGSAPLLRIRHLHSRHHRLPIFFGMHSRYVRPFFIAGCVSGYAVTG
mgnify:CR=1 FL=1